MNADTTATILVVDDEPLLLELFCEVLSDDFHVCLAHTVDEAKQVLAEQPIDLVISDYNLGSHRADTLIAWICQQQPQLVDKIILLTGEYQLDPEKQQYTYDILYKPIQMDHLLTVVNACIEQTRSFTHD